MTRPVFDFATILEAHGVALQSARYVRHDTRGLEALHQGLTRFESFISIQRDDTRSPYNDAETLFHFVPAAPLPGGHQTARFVCAHTKAGHHTHEDTDHRYSARFPDPYTPPQTGERVYRLDRLKAFDTYQQRIVIDWGASTRSWSQWAKTGSKEIIELRRDAAPKPFPGFDKFSGRIADVPNLPEGWIEALRAIGGIYLLTCPDTGQQYVGSAAGQSGLFGRWLEYATNGHGGNVRLKTTPATQFQVSVLEVHALDASLKDLLAREMIWKQKLGSRAFGLNAN